MGATDDVLAFESLNWLIVFNGMSDQFLTGFDAGPFRLRAGRPAYGMLGVFNGKGSANGPPTMDDAMRLADVIAFDHDAPIGFRPVMGNGEWGDSTPRDEDGEAPIQPVTPLPKEATALYWDAVQQSLSAVADLRFNTFHSFRLRYLDENDKLSSDFSKRFSGYSRVRLYAMAARQVDVLSEYMCLYRLLEASDGKNGKDFAKKAIGKIPNYDFGELLVVDKPALDPDDHACTSVFETYRDRAQVEIARLTNEGINIPLHLYDLRNGLAHGKTGTISSVGQTEFQQVVSALPILKLAARISVEETEMQGSDS